MSRRETPSRSSSRPGRKPKRRISDASESLGKPEAKRIQRDHSETEQLKSKVALQKMARPMPTDYFVSDMDRRKRVREILLHILSKLKVKVNICKEAHSLVKKSFRTRPISFIRSHVLFFTQTTLSMPTLT